MSQRNPEMMASHGTTLRLLEAEKTLRRLKLYQQIRILQTTFEQHAVNTRTMTMLSNVRTAA